MSSAMWLAFVVAAAIGAPLRYVVDGWVQERTGGAFPWGTFVVNVTGCLGLGLLAGFGIYHGADADVRLVVGTGALGAYTTFSTMTFETVRLAEEGAVDTALRNVGANLFLGLLAASAGLAIAAAV
jgi:fluoride exporter